ITDRLVLDRQLQETVYQLEHVHGVVVRIDRDSQQLADALAGEQARIIVTTLQKFPYVLDKIEALPARRYAVIVDEAHSSQTGEAAADLRRALSLEGAEAEESAEEAERGDGQDLLARSLSGRGRPGILSFFAFTATPKAKTLELFGTPVETAEGLRYRPFHLYSMRQAIDEGFILDVLANYATYKAYWRLLKKVEDDPRYDRKKAEYLLKSFVELHSHAIGEKVKICVEHFAAKVQGDISGRAKAMIVTRSRLHAVRYRLAVDKYLAERGYPFKALVAFSGTVPDGGQAYTESNMNGFPEAQTAKTFERSEYRF